MMSRTPCPKIVSKLFFFRETRRFEVYFLSLCFDYPICDAVGGRPNFVGIAFIVA